MIIHNHFKRLNFSELQEAALKTLFTIYINLKKNTWTTTYTILILPPSSLEI